jgi:glycosyltransferase involved in cell wall biosynthesis
MVTDTSAPDGAARARLAVAHLSPTFFDPRSVIGGGERYVGYLAQALRRASPGDGPRFSQTIFACGEREETFHHDGIALRVMRNDNIYPSRMDAISEALWRELERFDLVHVHQSLTRFGAYATAVARSLGKPVVATDLGGGDERVMLEGRGIALADGVVSISAYAHGFVAAAFDGPYEILIGPVDTDRFSPASRPAVRGVRRVIAVSRIMPHKGIDRIVAALPPGLSLTVVGRVYDEGYYERLRRMAAGKDVSFVHDADDARLVALYRASDLFAQASTARDLDGNPVAKPELMGLTTLEAMSCGLPVVVSDAGSLPELVQDPRFGRVFATHDELVDIFEDVTAGFWPPPDAARLARAHVVDRYAFGRVGARLAAFYARVLAAAA